MMNSDEILSHIQEGQLSDEVRIFRPPPFPLIWTIISGIILTILIFIACALVYILILEITGNEIIIDSSYWPIYSYYPYLIIPQLLLPFLLIHFNRRADKAERDTAIILLPEGFVQYKPWYDKNTRKPEVIYYGNVKEIILTSSGLAIHYKNGNHEKIYIPEKYRSPDSHTIKQQIIRDHLRFAIRTELVNKSG
jgi:hypothetical protein